LAVCAAKDTENTQQRASGQELIKGGNSKTKMTKKDARRLSVGCRGMVKITVLYKSKQYELDVDVNDSVEVLRLQLFSLTMCEPERQQLLGTSTLYFAF
jgi:hypothetical protein